MMLANPKRAAGRANEDDDSMNNVIYAIISLESCIHVLIYIFAIIFIEAMIGCPGLLSLAASLSPLRGID